LFLGAFNIERRKVSIMKNAMMWVLGLALIAIVPLSAVEKKGYLDSRVAKVKLPVADVELSYIEASPQMMVELAAGTTTVQGVRFFVGDGKIAVPLEADSLNGIKFQSTKMLQHGHKFAKYSTIELEKGYLTVDDLQPGDVYVIMPAINFVPKK
jgi:hypothetical protein